MIHRNDWAQIRRALYLKTGIDFGLFNNPDHMAKKIREKAHLIGELTSIKQEEFTIYPEPNWTHPTPVQGRTKLRRKRLPSGPMTAHIREKYVDVVKFEPKDGTLICRVEDPAYFLRWIKDIREDGSQHHVYTAEVDTGNDLCSLKKVWPWTVRRYETEILVAFRFEQ